MTAVSQWQAPWRQIGVCEVAQTHAGKHVVIRVGRTSEKRAEPCLTFFQGHAVHTRMGGTDLLSVSRILWWRSYRGC